MFSQIVIDRKAEQGFRRRALRAFPSEYIETLWGYVDGDTLNICVFMPIKHTAAPAWVDYDEEEFDHQEEEAAEYKLELLGTIHTHPDRTETHFSETDLVSAQDTQECVLGICAIEEEKREGKKRRVCRIAYWPTPRPLRITYKVARKK